jgi:hypothetical protein
VKGENMKYKCKISVNPTTGEFADSYFTEGDVYEFKTYRDEVIETTDDTGCVHTWDVNGVIFNKHFVSLDDIIINETSFPIEEILIPTKEDGGVNLRLENVTGLDYLCELWEDREELKDCDRIGIIKEDIPLLIKGLEAIYDEYMDSVNKG